jgi:hypothetical protein
MATMDGQDTAERILRLRMTLLRPPVGVQFCLQRGRSELVSAVVSTGADISLDLAVRAQPAETGKAVRFLGPFTQGPPTARFLYVCSGTCAGQHDSCWTRRAKISLAAIPWSMVEEGCASPHAGLEVHIDGCARDGGPACATVPLLNGGWHVCVLGGAR